MIAINSVNNFARMQQLNSTKTPVAFGNEQNVMPPVPIQPTPPAPIQLMPPAPIQPTPPAPIQPTPPAPIQPTPPAPIH